MNSIVKKIRKSIKDLGFFTSVLYALSKVASKLSSRSGVFYYVFVRQPVAEERQLPPKKGTTFNIIILDKDEPVLDTLPRPKDVIQQRFNREYICIAATKDDRIVGCIWLSLGPYIEDEVRSTFVPLPEGEAAWDFDVYIDPKYRLGFLFLKLWDEANRYMRERGYSATISRISGFNRQSLTSHQRMGAKLIGRAIYLCVFSMQIVVATKKPHVHLSFPRNDPPEFEL